MADVERVYTIPLLKAWERPRTQRAKYGIYLIRKFVSRHMKVPVENVIIDTLVNEAVWRRGIQKPPRRIKVRVLKWEADNVAEVLLAEE